MDRKDDIMKEKEYKIFLNGVNKIVNKNKYSFEEIIILAFGSFDLNNKAYTMTASWGKGNSKIKREYSYGDIIKIKEGMIINVDTANKS
jgi:hypothetical protein